VSAGYEMSLLAPSQKVREFNELFPDRVFATHSR
jgi:hypothetical protein